MLFTDGVDANGYAFLTSPSAQPTAQLKCGSSFTLYIMLHTTRLNFVASRDAR
jgi:hypothetical protein